MPYDVDSPTAIVHPPHTKIMISRAILDQSSQLLHVNRFLVKAHHPIYSLSSPDPSLSSTSPKSDVVLTFFDLKHLFPRVSGRKWPD